MCRLRRVSRIRIAAVDEVEEGKTLKFSFKRKERPMEGFVGRFNGTLFAYENTCRHIPISLDYGDNRFFTNQGDALMCQTHGAVYEPDTGLCTRGPCAGASLFPLEVVEEDGVLWFEED
ncbi:MAG: Rieske (2Fe-2S) protein [Limisphaerales bacterium]